MTAILQIIFLHTIFTFHTSSHRFDCSCDGWPSIKQGLEQSDIVFSGQVIFEEDWKNEEQAIMFGFDSEEDLQINVFYDIVRFKLDHLYKGSLVSETITIITPQQESACGYHFQAGLKYIVYGRLTSKQNIFKNLKIDMNDQMVFSTNLCTRTREWNVAEDDGLMKATQK